MPGKCHLSGHGWFKLRSDLKIVGKASKRDGLASLFRSIMLPVDNVAWAMVELYSSK